jgi:hypothetical protein
MPKPWSSPWRNNAEDAHYFELTVTTFDASSVVTAGLNLWFRHIDLDPYEAVGTGDLHEFS